MNERIKELATQAGIISAEYNGFDPTGLTKAQRKFAELIVKECAGIVENQGKFLRYDILAKKIKDHFEIKK